MDLHRNSDFHEAQLPLPIPSSVHRQHANEDQLAHQHRHRPLLSLQPGHAFWCHFLLYPCREGLEWLPTGPLLKSRCSLLSHRGVEHRRGLLRSHCSNSYHSELEYGEESKSQTYGYLQYRRFVSSVFVRLLLF